MTAPAARVAIAGAGGYVGTRLAHHLRGDRPVLALGRTLDHLPEGLGIERRSVDVSDVDATAAALRGCAVAYYFVHAMAGGDDFAERDREFARAFATAASNAGVERIVYLGGLGQGKLSKHLASRQEVGEILASGNVDTVELRAAVILGSGSISFEMLRYLTERLPAMVCPRWVDSVLCPLAEHDLLDYLEKAAAVPPGVYEIGGPDEVSYVDMMQAYARVRGLRRRRILRVPLLTPRLSAHWVDFVTPVDTSVSHSLIESLTNDVVVNDRAHTDAAFKVRPRGVSEALRLALDEQEERLEQTIFDQDGGLHDGVYVFRSGALLDLEARQDAQLDLQNCGGDLRWYGLAWAWRARILLGRLFGERLGLHHPTTLDRGEQVDWWTVREHGETVLVLATHRWFCGEAWLAYRTVTTPRSELQQVGALRAKGLPGWLYWRALWPIHLVVFRRMAERQAHRAHAIAASRNPPE
ncbi:MAG: hypothetical protein JWQ81_7116 [Amycolatopsis sp.]|uniref:DUF2867 domain-containing protein n=1 Tax=Amycolatopsis sp. TaxID=37632 RepID=UPI0026134054|nr:DUF2867 domain-containing protein [Amycolatopsis sp.]MCU1686377.1 hypothetical protein [Amycolatopsis sp.]